MTQGKNYRIKVKSGNNFIEIVGDKKFAEKMFGQISQVFPNAGKKPTPKKRGRKSKPKPKVDLGNMKLEKVVSLIRDKKESIQVLGSVYCILKRVGKHEVRSKDLIKFMEDSKLSVPSYPTYHFRKMTENGLLELGKKRGRFKITTDGITHLQKKLE